MYRKYEEFLLAWKEKKDKKALLITGARQIGKTIIDNIRAILERTPPELGADIYKRGIYLTGGSAVIGDLHQLIAQATGLKVNFAPHGQESVAFGLSQMIKNESLRGFAYSMQEFNQ